jgi:hypothetical protein
MGKRNKPVGGRVQPRDEGALVAHLVLMEDEPLGEREFRVRWFPGGGPDPVYLVGYPVLFTTEVHRAYVFKSRESAQEIIDAFPRVFGASASVHETGRMTRCRSSETA